MKSSESSDLAPMSVVLILSMNWNWVALALC